MRISWLMILWMSGIIGCMAQVGTSHPEKYTPHYYKRCALFDTETPITSTDIVMLGNSLTENGKDWSQRTGTTNIRNRGIVGDEAMGVYDRLHQILPGKPMKIFLLIGVNDVSHHLCPDTIVSMITKIITRIKKESPDTKLYVQSLLPINENKSIYKSMIGKTLTIHQVNHRLLAACNEHQVPFIDLFPLFCQTGTYMLRDELTNDGLHINDEGYAIWVNQLKNYL